MKKIVFIFILLLCLTGCGKQEKVAVTGVMEANENWILREISGQTPDNVYRSCAAEKTIFFVTYPLHGADEEEKDFRFRLFYMDLSDDREIAEIPYTFGEDEIILGMCGKGNVVDLYLQNNVNGESRIVSVDIFGNICGEINMNTLTSLMQENGFIGDMCRDSEGGIMFKLSTDVWHVNENGEVEFKTEKKMPVTGIGSLTNSGEFIITQHEEGIELFYEKDKRTLEIPIQNAVAAEGISDTVYMWNDNGIYMLKENNGNKSLEMQVDFVQSDIESNCVSNVILCGNNEIYIVYSDPAISGYCSKLYKFAEQEQHLKKNILKMGAYEISDDVRRTISFFNREQDMYQIDLVEYGADDEGKMRFSTDLLSEDCPDLFCLDSGEGTVLYNQNILEDLNQWIEQDEEISKEEFFWNVIAAFQSEAGKLYDISPGFAIHTLVMKKELLEQQSILTMDRSEELMFSGVRQSIIGNENQLEVFMNLCRANFDYFVNVREGTCCFDTKEFERILMFAYQCQEAEEEIVSLPKQLQDELALSVGIDIFEPNDFMLYTRMFETDVTFCGYPVIKEGVSNGNTIIPMGGRYAICKKSNNKEGAWEFIKTIMGEKYQKNECYSQFFPIRKDCMNYILRLVSNDEDTVLEDGTKVRAYKTNIYFEDYSVVITAMKQQEREQFLELVTSVEQSYLKEEVIMNILSEEAEKYFAGGQNKEQTQDVIQSRVSIYLAE